MRKRRKYLWLLLSLLTILGVVTGCGSTNNVEKSPASARETGDPVEGGTFHVAFAADPDSIDWSYSGATPTRDIGWHIFETLFALDKDYKVRPMIAEDYEISDDRKVYTIKIRPDVNFHNGEVVRVDDVIASINRWRKVSGVGKITDEYIEKVEEIDEHTIQITLTEVYSALLDDFAAPKSSLIIIPEEVAERAGEEPLQSENLIGTGPFQFDTWDRGNEIVLQKFTEYSAREEKDWGGLTGEKIAYVDEIKFLIVKDTQVMINGLKTGIYDYAQSISPDLYEVIEQDTNIDTISYINGYTTITPNKATAPFDDIEVRQALNYALDKEAIGKAVYGNDQFYGLDGALFDPTQTELYAADGTDDYDVYDPDKARALLDKSAYDGEPLKVMYANNYVAYEKVAEIMKQQLEEVGVKVELLPYEWATYLEKWNDPDNWDIVVVGWSTRFSPNELGMLSLGTASSGFYESERWEDAIEQWGLTEPGEERAAVLREMNEIVWGELPFIKVVNVSTFDIKSTNVKAYDGWVGQRFWNTWKSE